jgi:hypothetical protein
VNENRKKKRRQWQENPNSNKEQNKFFVSSQALSSQNARFLVPKKDFGEVKSSGEKCFYALKKKMPLFAPDTYGSR